MTEPTRKRRRLVDILREAGIAMLEEGVKTCSVSVIGRFDLHAQLELTELEPSMQSSSGEHGESEAGESEAAVSSSENSSERRAYYRSTGTAASSSGADVSIAK